MNDSSDWPIRHHNESMIGILFWNQQSLITEKQPWRGNVVCRSGWVEKKLPESSSYPFLLLFYFILESTRGSIQKHWKFLFICIFGNDGKLACWLWSATPKFSGEYMWVGVCASVCHPLSLHSMRTPLCLNPLCGDLTVAWKAVVCHRRKVIQTIKIYQTILRFTERNS